MPKRIHEWLAKRPATDPVKRARQSHDEEALDASLDLHLGKLGVFGRFAKFGSRKPPAARPPTDWPPDLLASRDIPERWRMPTPACP